MTLIGAASPNFRGKADLREKFPSPVHENQKAFQIKHFLGDTWGCRGDFVEPSLSLLKSPLCALCILSGATESTGPPGLRARLHYISNLKLKI